MVEHGTAWYGMVWHSMLSMRYGVIVWYDTVRYYTVQHGTVWDDAVCRGTVWYDTVWHSTVCHGVVRDGSALCGTVRYYTVWRGTFR